MWEIYAEDTEAEDAQARADAVRAEFEAAQKQARSIRKKPIAARPAALLGQLQRRPLQDPNMKWKPACRPRNCAQLAAHLTTAPEDFHVHPKVKKLLEQRAEMGEGKRPVDYGMAEALAFASLVKAGIRRCA